MKSASGENLYDEKGDTLPQPWLREFTRRARVAARAGCRVRHRRVSENSTPSHRARAHRGDARYAARGTGAQGSPVRSTTVQARGLRVSRERGSVVAEVSGTNAAPGRRQG